MIVVEMEFEKRSLEGETWPHEFGSHHANGAVTTQIRVVRIVEDGVVFCTFQTLWTTRNLVVGGETAYFHRVMGHNKNWKTLWTCIITVNPPNSRGGGKLLFSRVIQHAFPLVRIRGVEAILLNFRVFLIFSIWDQIEI